MIQCLYTHTSILDRYTNTQICSEYTVLYCTLNMYFSEHHFLCPQVTPPESMTPRHSHSITAISLGPGLTEVLVFGGLQRFGENPIAETTILRFGKEYISFAKFTPSSYNIPPPELTGPSASVAGPSAGKWVLVDVAHNDTRGSAQRLSEKRIRQATARASSVSETSDHSSQDRVRALEQQLRAAQQREHDTQHHYQLQLQEKDREMATQARELIEANHRHRNAEERAQLAEQATYTVTQLLLQLKDREFDPQETLPGQNPPFLLMCSIYNSQCMAWYV